MVNQFGVIPKGTSGKWRLIVDLSFLKGFSVNDRIDSAFCSLHYVKVDDAAKELFRQERGSCMAKVDIRSAYRAVPVNPREVKSLLPVHKSDFKKLARVINTVKYTQSQLIGNSTEPTQLIWYNSLHSTL